jgi:uncharacterized damage-inducible protein DinB
MTSLEIIQTLIEYHTTTTRRVWDSIEKMTDEQFLQDDAYSRGSIRNLMIHLASTDRRWLAGLKNLPDIGHLDFKDYPTRASGRVIFESVAKELMDYVSGLTEAELEEVPAGMPTSRAMVLTHLANHGTDHRATVLQKLTALGAPAFEQDFIFWLRSRK